LAAVSVVAGIACAQPGSFPLDSANGLKLHHVTAEPATLEGKKGVRLVTDDAALKEANAKAQKMTPQEAAAFQFEEIAVIPDVQFSDGMIEAEIAGAPAPGAPGDARGFVGIAFRVHDDLKTYDAFYIRPTNGRAEDQERRNHSAQYISHPDYTWARLRKETPSKYESYVDLMPGVWTKIRIEVHGDKARLYVNGQEQPTLVVNDVKSGAQGKGGVALWIGPGAIGHFRNLTVRPAR
jgi:hypothetical protein